MTNDTIKKNSYILFFTMTMFITYGGWLPLIFLKNGLLAFPNILLYLIGGLGPALTAVVLIAARHTGPEKKEYVRKLVNFKEIGVKWYLVILSYPLLTLVSLVIYHLIRGDKLVFSQESTILSNPLSYVLYALPVLIGVLGEEPGWRGYALRYMSRQHSALASSVIIGVIWALWHIPLFFIKDTYQAGIGVFNLPFAVYMVELIPESIIMSWIYFKTRQSTLAAILLHFMININPVDDLFEINPGTKLIKLLLFVIIAVLIAAYGLPGKRKD